MTIIVASLFLPYTPQFEADVTNSDTAKLVESSMIKVDCNNQELSNNKQERSSSVTSASSHYIGLPQEAQINGEPLQRANVGSPATGVNYHNEMEMLSSEQFLEELTANATHAANSGIPPANNPVSSGSTAQRPSVEEFFSAPSARVCSPSQEASASSISASRSSAHHNDLSSSLMKNPNLSFDSHPPRVRSSSKSAVITPVSKSVPDVDPAVVDVAKVREEFQQQASLPSMKRVSGSTAGDSSIASSSSNLRYSQQFQDNFIEDTDSEDDIDSDLETDATKKYNVPKFGGYSNNAKLRASLMRNSYELFKHLPWTIVDSDKGNGSLKNAVNIAVAEKTVKEPVSWVGTMGIPTDELPHEVCHKISKKLEQDFSSFPVVTDDITFKGAYKNYAKQILWPTLHYQIPDNPNSKAFEDHSWDYYQKVNQKFSDRIVSVYKPGDTIWIHDYHLMLVPQMVREKLPKAKIGFFLHVSFPSSEVFRCLANRERILEGIIGANFVGFQTKEYKRHFLQTCNRLLAADVSNDEVKYHCNIVSVMYAPIGIDYYHLTSQLRNGSVLEWRQLIKERWRNKKLIVCRDQFDRIRGLQKKMLAYERFLIENPEYIEKVVLIQICIGKSSDPEYERQIMVVVDRINSLSSNISISQPVVFLHQDLDFAQYLALNCEADVFLVDALREGMNLTCHEFIVSSFEKNAPLLLSEFTGSSSVLKEGAVLINPWDINHVAQSIKRSLEMSPEEKRRRWKKLFKSVIEHDSDNWITKCFEYINNAWESNQETSTVFNLAPEKFCADYKASKKHLFIFKISEPPTSRMLSLLSELSSNNIVYVLSSFTKNTFEGLYNGVLNIGLIAENGAYVRVNGSWYNIVEELDWMKEVAKIFDEKVERLPGSYYKIADSMIRFHTENAEDQDRVPTVIGEAITHINTLFDDRDIHAYVHKDIVFVQQTGLALAAAEFLMKFYNSGVSPTDNSRISLSRTSSSMSVGNNKKHFQNQVDFVCVSGSTSPIIEPLFKLVKQEVEKNNLKFGYTILYGSSRSTYAKEHINGVNELFTILHDLTAA
ncbi:Tps3p [Saccharomyces cerevisiae YJM1208]|nr:Tps3p [Saccharomyces cerevisiae YJM1208]AJS89624.1 Tps3p [Saccharomyces cerevisiae YJM1389]AJT00953.1 Tps3p [Saccharomyces cerevisiae YJM1592]AJT01394.1 Tps3p [Saccharomyces cerevisiae YJM1615]